MGEEFGAVVGLVVFEDAEDGLQEFAHEGDEGLRFGFAARQEALVEGAEVRGPLKQAAMRMLLERKD